MSAVQIVAIVLVVAGILGLCMARSAILKRPTTSSWAARVVGAGEADGQRPDLGWCGAIVAGGGLCFLHARKLGGRKGTPCAFGQGIPRRSVRRGMAKA